MSQPVDNYVLATWVFLVKQDQTPLYSRLARKYHCTPPLPHNFPVMWTYGPLEHWGYFRFIDGIRLLFQACQAFLLRPQVSVERWTDLLEHVAAIVLALYLAVFDHQIAWMRSDIVIVIWEDRRINWFITVTEAFPVLVYDPSGSLYVRRRTDY